MQKQTGLKYAIAIQMNRIMVTKAWSGIKAGMLLSEISQLNLWGCLFASEGSGTQDVDVETGIVICVFGGWLLIGWIVNRSFFQAPFLRPAERLEADGQ